MKAAELKWQNRVVVKKVQIEHFKTFRKAIGPELGSVKTQNKRHRQREGEAVSNYSKSV